MGNSVTPVLFCCSKCFADYGGIVTTHGVSNPWLWSKLFPLLEVLNKLGADLYRLQQKIWFEFSRFPLPAWWAGLSGNRSFDSLSNTNMENEGAPYCLFGFVSYVTWKLCCCLYHLHIVSCMSSFWLYRSTFSFSFLCFLCTSLKSQKLS